MQRQPKELHATIKLVKNSSIKCHLYDQNLRQRTMHLSEVMLSIFIENSSNDIPIKHEICSIMDHFPLVAIINVNLQKYDIIHLLHAIYQIFTDSMNLSQDIAIS